MEKIKIVILTLFLSVNLTAQDWYKQISDQSKLVTNITENESWEDIFQYADKELNIPKESLSDISKTIEFRKDKGSSTVLDQFFHGICDSTYSKFPYRQSGHLIKDLYVISKLDTSKIWQILSRNNGRSLYRKFAEIINIDEQVLLPQLLTYLKNNAATRLCIRPIDWDEPAYYLSISDIAMEIIEVKTYCDFFDNAAFSNKLFSNLKQDVKLELIRKIEEWYANTNKLSVLGKVEYFLNSVCELGHSYSFTCHNLLFAGDTTRAIKMYQTLYDTLSMPCRKEWDIGKILLSLGDRTVIEDCMNTSTNYRCMDKSGKKCVEILLYSEFAHYRDNQLAEIVSTEPNSSYRKSGTGPGYIWHKIFGELADYDKYKIPKTLIELMNIKDEFNTIDSYYTHNWENKFSEYILENYRICDLALLKYDETIEKLDTFNWDDINERDNMIRILKKKYED